MNASKHDLERRIADYYASEASPRAPDWVLDGTLATVQKTSQRRALASLPWRLNRMNGFAKLAVAAVIVVAAGLAGMAVLRPGSAPGPGGPVPSESPTPSPTRSLPPLPTGTPAAGAYVPPALSETFTSDIHGFSISYPAGWATQPATQPWTTPTPFFFLEPVGDFIYDPARTDHLFLGLASQLLDGRPVDEWAAAILTAEGCVGSEPVVVDGATGLMSECGMAAVSSEGRGYLFWLYLSGDDADLREFDYQTWFNEVLATVQLNPEAAVDAAPSASP